MIIILGLLVGTLICIFGGVLASAKRRREENWFICAIAFGIFLGIAFACLAVSRMSVRGEIEAFKEAERTLVAARKADISPVELAAIQQTVVASNKWLASTQYFAGNLWTNWFVPSDILELESIR